MITTLAGAPVALPSTLDRGAIREASPGELFYGPPEARAVQRLIHYVDGFAPGIKQATLGARSLALMNRLLALPESWDGFRARPVTGAAAVAAMSALFEVADDSSLASQIIPLPDGGVQLEWHAGGFSLEIEVDGAGSRHYFAANPQREVVLNADPAESGIEDLGGLVKRLLADLTDLVRRTR